jgi:hypothetical protein
VPDLETLLGHPVCGDSWEGFVIENLLRRMPDSWQASYYRTSARAEIDLVLEGPRRVVAVEVKRTAAPKVEKGFRLGCDEIRAEDRFYVVPRAERHPIGHGGEAIGLVDLVGWLNGEWQALPTRR